MTRRRRDPKSEALHKDGCIHPHSEKVSDELFVSNEFFDSRDLVQVKYEMLRRVRVDGRKVAPTAAAFGLSRPSFYQARAAFERGGLAELLPKKPGPRRAHKLSEELVAMLQEVLASQPDLSSADLAELVKERFRISVHPRSIERSLSRQEKKSRRPSPPRESR